MDRFLQLFGRFDQFSYACWDRIVLRGYYPRLQRPENIVHFLRDVGGNPRITPEVLARRTNTYRRWLDSYTEQHRITVLTAPKGVRKEEVVAPYYRSFKADAGVVVILKRAWSRAPRSSPMNPAIPRRVAMITGSSSAPPSAFCSTTSTFWTRSWVR